MYWILSCTTVPVLLILHELLDGFIVDIELLGRGADGAICDPVIVRLLHVTHLSDTTSQSKGKPRNQSMEPNRQTDGQKTGVY